MHGNEIAYSVYWMHAISSRGYLPSVSIIFHPYGKPCRNVSITLDRVVSNRFPIENTCANKSSGTTYSFEIVEHSTKILFRFSPTFQNDAKCARGCYDGNTGAGLRRVLCWRTRASRA